MIAFQFAPAGGVDRIEKEGSNTPRTDATHARNTHSAVFTEVRVDEQIGVIRVARVVSAIAAGRIINANFAEYHVPAHADIYDIEVIFVDEPDALINPLGVKGVGEIGIVGVAAAIANAVYHATGTRIRDLPITLDKLSRH